ncbi:tRNA (guanine(9)-N(1))-methyltransferase [Saitozyma podzolica]|uniref:tRNA (guanine(9)-N1)-methyltransferase n=1 Tax=Saitozyma podzolica TaxID=1890683 RepID=A0A427YNM3_9TREE|nr:tRNA (guanine(9)-N(1))-methyltransferase [Saitozyma podzolica]
MDPEEAAMNGLDILEGSGSGEMAAGEEPKMSKSAMKKAARKARMEELKPIRRQAEKERRRERAVQLAEGYAAGTLTPEERALVETRRAKERERRESKRKGPEKGVDQEAWKGGVIIDLGFDELMTDQEISSMASQLAFQYSTNRSAKIPISSVVHTSASSEASPRLWDRLAKSGCERWARCHFVEQDLDKIAAQWDKRKSAETKDEAAAGPSSSAGNVAAVGENPDKSVSGPMTEPEPALEGGMPDMGGLSPSGHSLVYLSADAEEELQTLREDEVYIIGGIVDRNRHKSLCQNKAERLRIRTAKLPIGKYIAHLPTRKVLTVNQVFDILVGYIDLQDWKAAFETALPPRKFVVVKKRKRGKKDSESDEAEVDSGTRQDAKDVDDESAEGEDGEDGADAEEALMNANA